jgi:DNA-directed RNA polymerase specialized sigma24 family protein
VDTSDPGLGAEAHARRALQSQAQLLEAIEGQIIPGLLRGDSDSYETLVRVYGPLVLATARHRLPSESDVALCFQRTFLTVLQAIDSFSGQSELWHWIHEIALRHCDALGAGRRGSGAR